MRFIKMYADQYVMSLILSNDIINGMITIITNNKVILKKKTLNTKKNKVN